MPFYTRSLLTKNQSARTLGILQRADRPPAVRQGIRPDFGGMWQGGREWGTGRAAPCCAFRGSLWVGDGAFPKINNRKFRVFSWEIVYARGVI